MQLTQEYFTLLEAETTQCRLLLQDEQAKRRALLASDEEALAKVMKSQQANMMQMESLEKQRMTAQRALGLGEQTAEQIAAALPEDERKRHFVELCTELRESAAELRELNAFSLDLAKEQLFVLEHMFEQSRPAQQSGVYGRNSKKTAAGPAPSFEEKI